MRDCDDPANKLTVTVISNPTRYKPAIIYQLARAGKITIEWYNLLGESLVAPDSFFAEEGSHEYSPKIFDAGWPAGIYLAVFRQGNEIRTCRIVIE